MPSFVSRLLIALDSRRAQAEANELAGSLDRVTRAGDDASTSARATAGAFRLVATAAGGFVGALGANELVQEVSRIESLNVRLSNLSGNLADTQSFLRTQSAELSVAYQTLGNSYASLLNLYDSGIITLERTRELTIGLTEAGRSVNLGEGELSLSVVGLTQALSAGIVSMEDYRQATDPIPGLNARIADSFGLSISGLKDLVSSGTLASDVFGERLVAALDTYAGSAARNADTISGAAARFSTARTLLLEEFTADVSGIAGGGLDALTGVLEAAAENAEQVGEAARLAGIAIVAAFGARATGAIATYAASQVGALRTAVLTRQASVETARAIAVETAARQASAAATAEYTAIRLREVQAQVASTAGFKRLSLVAGELAIAERAAATATAQLAAAQTAATGASARLATAQRATAASSVLMAGALRTGGAALALVGGPAGAAVLAAGGLAYLALKSSDAEKAADSFADALDRATNSQFENAEASRQAADAAIRAGRETLAALRSEIAERQSDLDGIRLNFIADLFDKRGIEEAQEAIEATKDEIDALQQSIANVQVAARDGANLAGLSNQLDALFASEADAVRAATRAADAIVAGFTKEEAKVAELQTQYNELAAARAAGSVSDDAQAGRALAQIQAEIERLDPLTKAREAASKASERQAQQLQAIVDQALPAAAAEREYVEQVQLLSAAYAQGGEDANQYREAIAALGDAYRADLAREAAEAQRELNDALSRRVDDPFAEYRADLILFERALSETPEKAAQIQNALAALDLQVTAELRTIDSGLSVAEVQQRFGELLVAQEEYNDLRGRDEAAAIADLVALNESFATRSREAFDRAYSNSDDQFAARRAATTAFFAAEAQAGERTIEALADLDRQATAEKRALLDARIAVIEAAHDREAEAARRAAAIRGDTDSELAARLIEIAEQASTEIANAYLSASAEVASFLNQFGDAQPKGIEIEVAFNSAVSAASLINDVEQRNQTLLALEQTYQDRATELVRAGEGSRSQIQEASGADRVAGLINQYSEQVSLAGNFLDQVLGAEADRQQRQAQVSLRTATNLRQQAEEARREFEQNGTDQNRIAAEQAEQRAAQAEAAARREFDQQKKAQIAQARASQLLAIMNAYASGGNFFTGAALAVTAGIATERVIQNLRATEFNGGNAVGAQGVGASVGAQGQGTTRLAAPEANAGQVVRETTFVIVGDDNITDERAAEVLLRGQDRLRRTNRLPSEGRNGTITFERAR